MQQQERLIRGENLGGTLEIALWEEECLWKFGKLYVRSKTALTEAT